MTNLNHIFPGLDKPHVRDFFTLLGGIALTIGTGDPQFVEGAAQHLVGRAMEWDRRQTARKEAFWERIVDEQLELKRMAHD